MIMRPAGLEQINVIRDMAFKIWPSVFKEILSEEQIDYMMEMIYSREALNNQISVLGHQYLIVENEGIEIGFVSYEINYGGKKQTKIHKIYLDQTVRGLGFGQRIINKIALLGKSKGNKELTLNVNRNNSALKFYLKSGFIMSYEENISIGNGFYMDDWVLIKPI